MVSEHFCNDAGLIGYKEKIEKIVLRSYLIVRYNEACKVMPEGFFFYSTPYTNDTNVLDSFSCIHFNSAILFKISSWCFVTMLSANITCKHNFSISLMSLNIHACVCQYDQY